MGWVEEQLIRSYFEFNGFLVATIEAPSGLAGRKRKGHPHYHLEVFHPEVDDAAPDGFQLFSSEIHRIRRARVRIEGWDESGFTARMLRNGKQMVEHLRKHVLKGVECPEEDPEKGNEGGRRVWVLPGLPSVDPHREEAVGLLREAGVEHALTFRTILDNVSQRVDPLTAYESAPALQLIRMMKLFEMVSPPQMDLFRKGNL